MTVRVNDWEAGLTPLEAVMVTGYVPLLPVARRAGQGGRPIPALSPEAHPAGQTARSSDSAGGGRAGRGHREEVPGDPSVNVVASFDVMMGAPSTVSVKDWLASGLCPLEAVMVIG